MPPVRELIAIDCASRRELMVVLACAVSDASICNEAQSLPCSGLQGMSEPSCKPRKIFCASAKGAPEPGFTSVIVNDPWKASPASSAGMDCDRRASGLSLKRFLPDKSKEAVVAVDETPPRF